MAFEKGNQLAAKSRTVESVIHRALVQDDHKRLREGVEAILDKASQGDLAALNFIADRTDGKPGQAVKVSGDAENPLEFIKRVIVNANDTNT